MLQFIECRAFKFHAFSIVNQFQANVPFIYPLKTPENQQFSDFVGACRNGLLAWNRLSNIKKVDK